MSLDGALDVILGITPVPGLSAAFNLLKFIVSSIKGLQASVVSKGLNKGALLILRPYIQNNP